MKLLQPLSSLFLIVTCLFSVGLNAEILAMLNYESKPDDKLKELKMPAGTETRREGIAVIDVDPNSDNYGKILIDIPLPPDLVAHHIFYNRDATKAYVTALGKPELRVIDMTRNPYRIKVIDIPECQVGGRHYFFRRQQNLVYHLYGIQQGYCWRCSYGQTPESHKNA